MRYTFNNVELFCYLVLFVSFRFGDNVAVKREIPGAEYTSIKSQEILANYAQRKSNADAYQNWRPSKERLLPSVRQGSEKAREINHSDDTQPTEGTKITHYYHHGVFTIEEDVCNFYHTSKVSFVGLSTFKNGGDTLYQVTYEKKTKKKYIDIYNTIAEIRNRGEGHKHNRQYELLEYNCEHFANEIIYGEAFSAQVQNFQNMLKQLSSQK